MGLSPFGLTAGSTFKGINSTSDALGINKGKSELTPINKPNSTTLPTNNESSINDNLTTAKDSSLLYQLINRLLLIPEPDRQLTESLSKVVKLAPDNSIFNSLLMLRLVDNKQFITELHNTDIQSIDLDYQNISSKSASGDKIVQLSEYQTSESTQNIAQLLLQYKSRLKP